MTKILDSEFKWQDRVLIHMPTGATFDYGLVWDDPDAMAEWKTMGRIGDVLEDGRCYEKDDVLAAADRIKRAAERKG